MTEYVSPWWAHWIEAIGIPSLAGAVAFVGIVAFAGNRGGVLLWIQIIAPFLIMPFAASVLYSSCAFSDDTCRRVQEAFAVEAALAIWSWINAYLLFRMRAAFRWSFMARSLAIIILGCMIYTPYILLLVFPDETFSETFFFDVYGTLIWRGEEDSTYLLLIWTFVRVPAAIIGLIYVAFSARLHEPLLNQVRH